VLAFAPSQHAKHAFLAMLAAHELRDDYGERWDDLLVECARYTAESRQPWSEPPILTPPEFDRGEPYDVDALRAAVAARDRLAGERWLAARLHDANLADDLMTVAADDFEDFGLKVIVTSAAFKLVPILGEKGKYATLRCVVWEIVAGVVPASSPASEGRPEAGTTPLRERLIANAIAEQGSLEAMHHVFLYEAAKGTVVFDRVCDYLSSVAARFSAPRDVALKRDATPPVYRLGRDYAQCLNAYALREPRLAAAAAYNLEHAPSFADWSFA
ncbi:MAG TPA: hypothetical protein VLU46_01195, partial [Thermoanaerobaculia bacterium]|nr:hypothetical protein [Thermoanaerobaculia bacterium]